MKRILFILRNTPYGSSKAREGIDAVLAASVFDQHITVLFMDEGIWQLHSHQQSRGIADEDLLKAPRDHKNIAALLESFPLYDINELFVDSDALERFQLKRDELILEPELVDSDQIRRMIRDSNIVFTY